MKIKTIVTAAVSSLLIVGTHAEPLKERGGYIGAAYGLTNFDDDGALEAGDAIGRFNLDEDGQAWQIYGGYRFFKYFAVEGRYTDFGDYTADGEGFLFIPEFDDFISLDGFKAEAEITAFTVHAIGIYPFGQSGFDIYGQLGVGAVFYEATLSGLGQNIELDDDSTSTWSAGAGVRYTPPRLQQLTVQLAADIYSFEVDDPFGNETYDQSLTMAKLGIQYNF